MPTKTGKPADRRSLAWLAERLLALLAAFVCLAVTIYVWQTVSSHQSMWPLPALYLLEILALCATAAIATFRGIPASDLFVWAITGLVSAFTVLGMLSIGMLYVPVVVLLVLTGLLSILRTKRSVLVCLAAFITAAAAQVSIVLTVLRL